jgi:hypothetical protein
LPRSTCPFEYRSIAEVAVRAGLALGAWADMQEGAAPTRGVGHYAGASGKKWRAYDVVSSAAGQRGRCAVESKAMLAFKAQVKDGRLVLDEPTSLPEGEVVYLVPFDDEGDAMAESERARVDDALERSMAQARAGRLVDADDVIEGLLARE